ncbi:hypothetical protein AVEN_144877-2 [Araneus ventricosus]|uniref:Uncharacterized protein n=1 Tax=Araneus ventricosus TaxID=182803 RepID=A0A4Y2EDW1_ARAVE|nr:hypothetical protein AVEN_144877-2 [Araneus ventricosus]
MLRINEQTSRPYKCYIPMCYGCRRHCPKCNKTQTNECYRLWPNIPPPRANLPAGCTPFQKCEDVCCSSKKSKADTSNADRSCFRCDHVPPPQLRFNYSTQDGEHDPKSNLARYETTTNMFHGRKPLLNLIGYHDPSNMRTPRFLEICPASLRFRDQRP